MVYYSNKMRGEIINNRIQCHAELVSASRDYPDPELNSG